jgi:SAM-dependent methyltransferase
MRPFAPAPDEPLLRAFQAGQLGDAPLPALALHPDDHMLRFFRRLHHGHRETVLVDYLRSGLAVWRALEQVLDWRFGGWRRPLRCLDFAAGFGRVTRWLAQGLGGDQVWAAEVFLEAIAFQEATFGVQGVASAADPAAFDPRTDFDCILACSFFSHVPPEAFVPWLERLWSLLRPGGVLVFSVVDAALLAGDRVAPSTGGTAFQASSEIEELPGSEYGVLWADEEFVRSAVDRATGGGGRCRRLPRALWAYQDLWVVWRPTEAEAELSFVTQPVGFLESAERSLDGRWLTLGGWACDPAGPGPLEAGVALDGETVAVCSATLPHPSVRAAFPAVDEVSGWACSVGSPGRCLRPDGVVAVTLTSAGGAGYLVHLGTVEGTELFVRARADRDACATAQRRAAAAVATAGACQEKLGAAERRLELVAASRFWKARERWWALKGWAGLSR